MSGPSIKILDSSGQPMTPSKGSKASMLAGYSTSNAYDAASLGGEHMAEWQPYLLSPDAELNVYRDRIVARSRDIERNDGWASGAVTRILDNAIGATFRPISKPDYRALQRYTGNPAFDRVWAKEYAYAADAHYRVWANDVSGKYCDAQRSMWLSLMFGVAFRHLLTDNDALAVMEWLPDRVGPGRAHYATAVQLVDPDRLSNPQMRFDSLETRGGVRVDAHGAAIGYYIRKAHQGDWWAAGDSVQWQYLDRQDEYGRPIVVHYFEPSRAAQHRGGAGIFTPVLERLKMLFQYDKAELDGAILNAVFAAIAESPFDHELLGQAMGEENAPELNGYQNLRNEYHREKRLQIGGAKVTPVFPGEKIEFLKSERPNANFPDFEKAVLRNVAAAVGASTQQISGDWSDTNYSSARAAMLEAWKTIQRRRHNFGEGFASPIRQAWLEESVEVDDYPLPAGAPDFLECRAAYSRCRWMGPGRGWIDPVAEKKGAVLGMDAGLSTLEAEAAEGSGEDWEEILDQRREEIEGFKIRGLQVPSWAQMQPATDTIKDPEPK